MEENEMFKNKVYQSSFRYLTKMLNDDYVFNPFLNIKGEKIEKISKNISLIHIKQGQKLDVKYGAQLIDVTQVENM